MQNLFTELIKFLQNTLKLVLGLPLKLIYFGNYITVDLQGIFIF
jgi:hypothetical protein